MKIKSTKLTKIVALIIGSVIGINFLCPIPTFAANSSSSGASNVCDSDSGAPQEVKDAAGCEGKNADVLPGIIQGILNAIITVTSTVAVVYIVIGGIQYMTSSGDTSKLEKAKKTILYACIGLVICVLAFAIVNWTISAIPNTPTDSEKSNESSAPANSSKSNGSNTPTK